jgi:hypothetical protein
MKLLSKELSYYRQLSFSSQNLFFSFVAFGAVEPLFGIFASAYIWKQSKSIEMLVGYQVGIYLGLVLAFFLNIPLISRFSLVTLHALFLGLRIVPLIALFFIVGPSTETLFVLGGLTGGLGGIYWANRILLSYELTKREERNYFIGLELTSALLLAVLVPFFVGLLLGIPALEKVVSYKIVASGASVALLLGSWRAFKITSRVFPPEKPLGIFWTRRWLSVRLLYFMLHFFQGSMVLFPPLLVLNFIGSEFSLGSIQSIASLGVALSVYVYGRKATPSSRLRRFASGVLAAVAGAVALILLPNFLGITTYLILSGLGVAYMNGVVNPLFFDIVEENVNRPGQSYRFIVDREIFMNLGRLTLLLCVYLYSGTEESYLFLLPVVCAAMLLPLVVIMKYIIENTSVPQDRQGYKIIATVRRA